MSQLALDFSPAPRQRRTSALRSFKARNETVAEALAGERLARKQDAWVLAWFRGHRGRATPSEVHDAAQAAGFAWLLTSIRRSLTNLSDEMRWREPPLRKHPEDRRPSPRGGRECTWSLR